jgi:type VI secretion system FHA domain protein
MLELNIIDGIRPDNPTEKRKIFSIQGGSIGRDAACTWVLVDRQRVISSTHAKIMFSQGAYYLSDVSTNGILSNQGQPIGKGELRKLNRGDIYIIGPYRLEVTDIKLIDPSESFRDAGLQHLLAEPEREALTPLNYAQKSEATRAHFSFDANAGVAPNTLKAYDFMPEPLDLVLSKTNEPKTVNPCLPEEIFTPPVNTETVMPAQEPTRKPEPEATATPNLPMALSGMNFLQELCQAFNIKN